MRPSLQLRIGQQLTMTPQLQQAIKLLQLSTLDLQQEIQEALESNPLLEVDESPSTNSEESTPDKLEEAFMGQETQVSASEGSEDPAPTSEEVNASEALEKTDIPEELSMDTTWDDNYSASMSTSSAGPASEDFTYQGETTDSIQDHLRWQMELTPFSETDEAIATALATEGTTHQGPITGEPDVSRFRKESLVKPISQSLVQSTQKSKNLPITLALQHLRDRS